MVPSLKIKGTINAPFDGWAAYACDERAGYTDGSRNNVSADEICITSDLKNRKKYLML